MTKIHTKINLIVLIGIAFFITFGLNALKSTPTSPNSTAIGSNMRIAAAQVNYTSDFINTWGGIDSDTGWDIALDDSGNIYISGSTESFGAGKDDAFIAKFDSSGNSILNITWGGSGIDAGTGIVLDDSGNIYITGATNSSGTGNFDAFIAKFNSTGHSLLNITWGGNDADGGYDILLDDSGNIFITGYTESFGAGDNDAFIAKFNSTGHSLLNVTWGGSDSDDGYSIALDALGNIYIAGSTWSFGIDAFIAKFNSSGHSLLNITWSGGDAQFGWDMALDGSGNIYITGYVYGFGNLAQAFIVKFNNTGHLKMEIIWGGNNYDVGFGIALDGSGNIYITGTTDSFGAGGYDLFIAKFNSTGHSLLNTTLGGIDDDWGKGIALDNYGNIFITGYTESFGAGSHDTIIAKYRQISDNDSGSIPGYDLLFLIGFLGLSLVLLTKKYIK
ncbi:MAG: SBBP repeat-containing protein [Candidatus Lokiarchaeota archaeon]|nr:SBBP repeat-containing protein [Candidatus Lokiarchaeota archaeon]